MNSEIIKYSVLAFIKKHFPILSGFYVSLFKVKSGLDFNYDRLIANKEKFIRISTLKENIDSFNLFDVDIYLNNELELYFELLIPTDTLNLSLVDWNLNSYFEYILDDKIKLLPEDLLKELNDSYYNYKLSNINIKVVSQTQYIKLPYGLYKNNIYNILDNLRFINENKIYDDLNDNLLKVIESSKITKNYFEYYGYSLNDYYTKELYIICVLNHLPIKKYLKDDLFVIYVKVNNYIVYSVITYDTTNLHKECYLNEIINIKDIRNDIEINFLQSYLDSYTKLIFLPQIFVACPLDFCFNTISMVSVLTIVQASIYNFSRYSKQELELLEETIPLINFNAQYNELINSGFTFVNYNYINKFKHLLPKE